MLNILVTLAWQVRAEWLGLVLGLLAWGLLTGRLHRVVVIGMAVLTVLGMIDFLGINLVSRTGGAVSLSETLGRFIAPINLELAKAIEPTAARHVGTAEWRELWWKQIWISAHSTPMLEAFGHGYGFDLFGLAPAEVRSGQEDWDVRTPHSVFYYALGYTGWVGVMLFSLLQFTILRLLWRSFRVTRQPAGLVFWVLEMGMAFLVGMAIAPALQQTGTSAARAGRAPTLRPQFAHLRAEINVAAGRNPGTLVVGPVVGRGDLGAEWPRAGAS
jgi:hypothetical protein